MNIISSFDSTGMAELQSVIGKFIESQRIVLSQNMSEIHAVRTDLENRVSYLEKSSALFKANNKRIFIQKVKDLRKKLGGITDANIFISISMSTIMPQFIGIIASGYEQGKINRKTYRDIMQEAKSPTVNPLFQFNEELHGLESEVLVKRRVNKPPIPAKNPEPPIIKISPEPPIIKISPEPPIIKISPKSDRSTEERVLRIKYRLINILNKTPDVSKEAEVQDILTRLARISKGRGIDNRAIVYIDEVRELANRVLQTIQQAPPKLSLHPTSPIILNIRDGSEHMEIPARNKEAIRYIEYLLIKITHRQSSTRINGNKSYGDGSFAVKIFHPFLTILKNQIFTNPNIDASHISWNEIITEYEKCVVDSDQARTLFRGILKTSTEKDDFLTIFGLEFHNALSRFSSSGLYVKKEKKALGNIFQALEEHSPARFQSLQKDISEVE